MYTSPTQREADDMNIYFLLRETDRKSINPDVLFYAGQASGLQEGKTKDVDWLQLFSLVQPFITAALCVCVCVRDSSWVKWLQGIRQLT